MKISEKLAAAEAEGRVSWSFEYFPPKTDNGLANLYDRIQRMAGLGPIFIDITWGAGGSTTHLTTDFVKTAHKQFGLETCMHLTCTNMPREQVDKALKDAYDSGCENILALRGDPPRGTTEWTATEGGFEHAIDLVRHIRSTYGDHFDIAVAGHPEGHTPGLARAQETIYLKQKIDAGASFIFTQMFYDIDIFFDWCREIRAAGITVPIVPGIMPIQSWAQFKRITIWNKTTVPQSFLNELEPIQNDDQAVREVGTRLIAEMCRKILESEFGIKILHFYTMNLERGTKMILDELQFTPSRDITNPLPWRLSLSGKRRTESIRPIFWANRTKSYLSRTETWDEFPNGRWGDSRSPAYGELDGYGININPQTIESLKSLTQPPTQLAQLASIFVAYCDTQQKATDSEVVKYLPWSDIPLSKETYEIEDILVKINQRGFLTINSQPAVDGAKSSDPVHGWGPRGGYVYQKAYLEFFCSPDRFKSLKARLDADPDVTYYAVTKTGELKTNNTNAGPNAVTWGVFPGKEIIQPTIVELVSFLAWKDEAFELGQQWAELYSESKPEASQYLKEVMQTWFLVNIVNNDFRKSNLDLGEQHEEESALFKFFKSEPLVVGLERKSEGGGGGGGGVGGSGGSSKEMVNGVKKIQSDGFTSSTTNGIASTTT